MNEERTQYISLGGWVGPAAGRRWTLVLHRRRRHRLVPSAVSTAAGLTNSLRFGLAPIVT